MRWKHGGWLVLAAMVLFCAGACAAAPGAVWLSGDGALSVDAMQWYGVKDEYWFFIPGNRAVESLAFGMQPGQSLVFTETEQTVSAGDSASFLQPGDYAVLWAGKNTVLHVMAGSPGFPAVYITTASGKLDTIHKNKNNREKGNMVFVSPQGVCEYRGTLDTVKMRGNSSVQFNKKNYLIKCTYAVNLEGMGQSKTWVLTGNYRDKTLLRNQIVLDTAQYIGLDYTPEHVGAEVYINHEYMGFYLLSEKIMISPERVAIDNLEKKTEALNGGDLSIFKRVGKGKSTEGQYKAYSIPVNPPDITGGYLLEYKRYQSAYADQPSVYTTKRGNLLVVRSPEYTSINQMKYISTWMQTFENAIFAADGRDPKTRKRYTELVDLDSLVLKYMLEEFCKNYDGNTASLFFYKPSDSQSPVAYAGPAWDYDSSFGSYAGETNAASALSGKGFWISNSTIKKTWWPALYKQKDFQRMLRMLWPLRMKPAMEILLGQREDRDEILFSVSEYAQRIRKSAEMNFVRWPIKAHPTTVAQTGATFDDNTVYLQTFLADRYAFLCGEWDRPPEAPAPEQTDAVPGETGEQ